MNRIIGQEGCSVADVCAAFRESPDAVVLVREWPKLAKALQISNYRSRIKELENDLFYSRKCLLDVVGAILDDWRAVGGNDARIFKLANILGVDCGWKDLAGYFLMKFRMEVADDMNWRTANEQIKYLVLTSKIIVQDKKLELEELLNKVSGNKEDILNTAMTGPLISQLINSQVTELSGIVFAEEIIPFDRACKALIMAGPKPYAIDSDGQSVAHRGAERLQGEELHAFFQILIRCGLGKMFRTKDLKQRTPIHVAVFVNKPRKIQPATLELLHSSLNIDFNARDFAGETELHYAVSGLQPKEILQLMVKLGGDPKWRSDPGHGVFHHAGAHGNAEAVEYFASIGYDINQQDNRGLTGLHYAAHTSHDRDATIAAFLKCGADANIVNNEGYKPLQ